jgi:hypothetical protein
MTAPRTLFIHAGALGDFVLSLSLVQAIAESQSTPVTMLARGEFAPVAALQPDIERFVDINAGPWHKLFGDEPQAAIDAISATSPFHQVVDAIGISSAACEQFRRAGVKCVVRYDPRPIPGDERHITEQWAFQLRSSGVDIPSVRPPDLRHSSSSRRGNVRAAEQTCRVRCAEQRTHQRVSVIHVGSGGRAKCWPLDRFVELAKSLNDADHRIVFPLGPAEQERDDVQTNRDRLASVGTIVELPSLAELIALLQSARVYIGNDSGPTHLAAALGLPTIPIFGPTDPKVWSPLGQYVRGVQPIDDWPTCNDLLRDVDKSLVAVSAGHCGKKPTP